MSDYSKINPDTLVIREISHNKGGVIFSSVSLAEIQGCLFYSVYNDMTNYSSEWIDGGTIIHWPYFKIKGFS